MYAINIDVVINCEEDEHAPFTAQFEPDGEYVAIESTCRGELQFEKIQSPRHAPELQPPPVYTAYRCWYYPVKGSSEETICVAVCNRPRAADPDRQAVVMSRKQAKRKDRKQLVQLIVGDAAKRAEILQHTKTLAANVANGVTSQADVKETASKWLHERFPRPQVVSKVKTKRSKCSPSTSCIASVNNSHSTASAACAGGEVSEPEDYVVPSFSIAFASRDRGDGQNGGLGGWTNHVRGVWGPTLIEACWHVVLESHFSLIVRKKNVRWWK